MVNEGMRELWTTVTGPHWIEYQHLYDRMLEGLTKRLLAALPVEEGQLVLDVGCGTGTTAGAISALGAEVVGIDISPTMIAEARARFPELEFVVADAQVDDLGGPYDAIVSRFGVMFFEDPVAAFGNLAAATRSGGTMTFICWRGLADNPIFVVGGSALTAALPIAPAVADPLTPGPLAFADPARVRGVLIDAGWTAIEIVPIDAVARFAAGGSDGVDERMTQLMASETGRRFLDQVAPADRPPALAAARKQLEAHLVDGVLQLPAAAWLVHARR